MYNKLPNIEQQLRNYINTKLKRAGLLFRIYSRIKDENSVLEKIKRRQYESNNGLLQDLIGIKISTYFGDDIFVLSDYFNSHFEVLDYEEDDPIKNRFRPVRLNIVCRLSNDLAKQFNQLKKEYPNEMKYMDSTFEIQIRTLLADSWHQIDHEMRYKCKDEWKDYEARSELFDEIHANLGNNDKSLYGLFDDLSIQHYRNKSWMGMLRNKYRLHFIPKPLSQELSEILDTDYILVKQLFKADRETVINALLDAEHQIEVSFDNIVYLSNHLFIHDERILKLMPEKCALDTLFDIFGIKFSSFHKPKKIFRK